MNLLQRVVLWRKRVAWLEGRGPRPPCECGFSEFSYVMILVGYGGSSLSGRCGSCGDIRYGLGPVCWGGTMMVVLEVEGA